MTRDYAVKLVREKLQNNNLFKHCLAAEACLVALAEKLGENSDKWRLTGLLHDIDYERYPDKHCLMVREILSSYSFPEEYLRAIESHGYKLVTDVEPVETMEKVLYATDELTGLIVATVILRPSKSIMDLKVSSVKKKWKQKGFASGVNRDVIAEGAKMLDMERDVLIEHTIKGMQTVAEEIGLKGKV